MVYILYIYIWWEVPLAEADICVNGINAVSNSQGVQCHIFCYAMSCIIG